MQARWCISARKLCRKHAISDAIFYTQRKKYGSMEVSEVKRLRSPEEENAKLKKLLAEAMQKHYSGVALSRKFCRNGVPAGLQVCSCQPFAMRFSVRRLMHSYQAVS
ncbi:transposase [Enterobacter ludwigii]|uniref:transposase n=1 Tax=Enterobacter ludwigii TaxID=299767 RepID=UPI003AFF650A